MNIKEINENFDREYDKYKNSSDYKAFVKIKMPEYYIGKHSDEDLQAAVLAEREACLAIVETHPTVRAMSIAIRKRGEQA